MVESHNGLYKTELIRQPGLWRTLDDVKCATLEWVDWFNHRRVLEPIWDVPPAWHEANHYRQNSSAQGAGLTTNSLR
jgi:transposase InsO family protein